MHILRLAVMAGGLALLIPPPAAAAPTLQRTVPIPLPGHPGNLFVSGENVLVPVPTTDRSWHLRDYEDRLIADTVTREGHVALGQLPLGFYRLFPETGTNWISLGVVAPLRKPTPADSPIALDVAMSWFYPSNRMDAVASLCALAGVNWVRDRLAWSEVEPRRGEFAPATRYDAAARAQTQAGLRVLQVTHSSPVWANPNVARFPIDLRDSYRWHSALARRWKGSVRAFEPWNEADIPMFGGHTGAEMASLQKAAYFGLKQGNPKVLACLNVFALHNQAQLEDLDRNEAWPFFDTFNLHHYEPFDNYPKLYANFRAVSAGKPLWVTECSLPVKWVGDDKLQEPSEPDLRVQSERVAKTFAASLHEGASATFYFILPHFVEGKTQFGIVRPDLTPRPAFLALAAVGRLLAGARPLGSIQSTGENLRAYCFRAKPDGRARDVLVAWAVANETSLTLPVAPEGVFDHLGRSRSSGAALRLTRAPVFVLLPVGSHRELQLSPPPANDPPRRGEPCPVVFQALWPTNRILLPKSAYRIAPDAAESIPVFAYNFGSHRAKGPIRVSAPEGWTARLSGEVDLAPMERQELTLAIRAPAGVAPQLAQVDLDGDFGTHAKSRLSLRFMPDTRSN